MNIIRKGSKIIMGILSGHPQNEPLHYGEVFALWSSLSTAKGAREDIGLLFGQMSAKKAKDGAALLQIMKNKGWLVLPPLHHETKQQ